MGFDPPRVWDLPVSWPCRNIFYFFRTRTKRYLGLLSPFFQLTFSLFSSFLFPSFFSFYPSLIFCQLVSRVFHSNQDSVIGIPNSHSPPQHPLISLDLQQSFKLSRSLPRQYDAYLSKHRIISHNYRRTSGDKPSEGDPSDHNSKTSSFDSSTLSKDRVLPP